MKCSICKKETDREPIDRLKPVVCYDCFYKCKECGVRLYSGGHQELCTSCLKLKEEKDRQFIKSFKSI